MRVCVLSALVLVCALACTDSREQQTSLATGPAAPTLTMRTLPKGASTICVASVRQRDDMLAKPQSKTAPADRAALDALIDDVCQ